MRKEYIIEQEHLRKLDSVFNKDINKIKFSAANTLNHELTKAILCYKLLYMKHRFVVEAHFSYNKGRADVYDITTGIAYEIVNTEKEESIIKKKTKYPVPIIVLQSIKDYYKTEEYYKNLEVLE